MKHLSDPELLLAAEGELAEGWAHLRSCFECRARLAAMERAMGGFAAEQRREAFTPARDGKTWWRWAAAAAALIAVAGLPWMQPRVPGPNARLTPGSTVAVSLDQVCRADDEPRIVPASLAQQVFREYGIRDPKPGAYEVDYLITPALGGADDLANLWPQPYSETAWNAHIKDALEDYLRDQVCAGRMDLAAAQRELSTDWIAAYKRHFRTERPLAMHAQFRKDRPWE